MSTFTNAHLSVSRLRLYEQCPRAFYFKYANKGPSLPPTDAPVFGVVLHAALEETYRWIISDEYSGPFPVDVLIGAYKKAWVSAEGRDGSEEIRSIVGVALYQEGLTMLRTFAAAEGYVDSMDVLAVEQEFNITVGPFKVNGFIDLVERVDDETVGIVDHKSNRVLYTANELETDLQMSIYALAVRELYPWAKRVVFSFNMLRFATRQETTRTAATIDDAAGYVSALGERIEADTAWAPRLNENCMYCDHRERCDAYGDAISGKKKHPLVRSLDTIDDVVREREKVATLAKALYARKEECDKILKKKIAKEGSFEAAGHRVALTQAYTTSYRKTDAVEAFYEALRLVKDSDAFACDFESLTEAIEGRFLVVDPEKLSAFRDEVCERLGPRGHVLKVTLDALATKTPSKAYNAQKVDVRAIKGSKTIAHLAKSDKKEP